MNHDVAQNCSRVPGARGTHVCDQVIPRRTALYVVAENTPRIRLLVKPGTSGSFKGSYCARTAFVAGPTTFLGGLPSGCVEHACVVIFHADGHYRTAACLHPEYKGPPCVHLAVFCSFTYPYVATT